MRRGSSGELEELLSRTSVYPYSYIEGFIILGHNIDPFLEAVKRGNRAVETTLDLGSGTARVEVRGGDAIIGAKPYPVKELEEAVEEGFSYKALDWGIVGLDMYRDGGYYKLKPVALDRAPTIEINGVQMHRTVGADLWVDARGKARVLGRVRRLGAC